MRADGWGRSACPVPFSLHPSFFSPHSSNCRLVGFPGADADDLTHSGYENLAVADLPGAGGLDDGIDRAFEQLVGHDHLDLHLRQEIDDVFRAAIKLGVPLLPAESFYLGYRQTADADFRERLAHFIEFEWLENRFDFFHGDPP